MTTAVGSTTEVGRHTSSPPKTKPVQPRTGEEALSKEESPPLPARVPGKLLFPEKLNNFFRTVNGYVEGQESDKSKHNYFSLLDLTKSVWFMTPFIQAVGLFNERAEKFARGFYGACWSIVYSCYRPFEKNVETLTDTDKEGNQTKDWKKKIFNANQYFKVGMGSLVSAVYGGGAFGMLWGALTGKDDFFDKAAEVYTTGMLNQNQVFASMNAAICMQRANNPNQLDKVHRENDMKARIEFIDSLLFIPNIFTRGLATLKMFGMNLMGDGVERFVRCLDKFSYGTWGTRFSILKGSSEDGGDLKDLKAVEQEHSILYNTQKKGSKAFLWTVPTLSWISAGLELFGLREGAEKVFRWEGIVERLNPMIAAWCLGNPWLTGFLKVIGKGEQPIAVEAKEQEEIKQQPVVELARERNRAAATVTTKPLVAAVGAKEVASLVPAPENKVTTEPVKHRSLLADILLRNLEHLDLTDDELEKVFEAAKAGEIGWEEIVKACERGFISLRTVQLNMDKFPTDEAGQKYLDDALLGAEFTEFISPVDSNAINRPVEVKAQVPSLARDTIRLNHESTTTQINHHTTNNPLVFDFTKEKHRAIKQLLKGEYKPTEGQEANFELGHVLTSLTKGWTNQLTVINAALKGHLAWDDFLTLIQAGCITLDDLETSQEYFTNRFPNADETYSDRLSEAMDIAGIVSQGSVNILNIEKKLKQKPVMQRMAV